jgi:sugar O-acyltransferase (sialic acid O-acetyltransferase NeuD family)
MKKALIGSGGHAREVQAQMGTHLKRFVHDDYWEMGDDDLLPLSQFDPNSYSIMIAVSKSKDREDIVKQLPPNTKYFSFTHPTAQLMSDDIIIGEGSFIGANSIITCNVKIGNHSILNRGNHIGHDCRIGDYFSAMPGSIISGNVTIGNRFYIGTNSSIREKILICDDVTIGLNTGVVKNILKSGTYLGHPVKKLIKDGY